MICSLEKTFLSIIIYYIMNLQFMNEIYTRFARQSLLYRDLQRALLGSFYYIFEKRKQQERIQKE